jgi:hypothetical protein
MLENTAHTLPDSVPVPLCSFLASCPDLPASFRFRKDSLFRLAIIDIPSLTLLVPDPGRTAKLRSHKLGVGGLRFNQARCHLHCIAFRLSYSGPS